MQKIFSFDECGSTPGGLFDDCFGCQQWRRRLNQLDPRTKLQRQRRCSGNQIRGLDKQRHKDFMLGGGGATANAAAEDFSGDSQLIPGVLFEVDPGDMEERASMDNNIVKDGSVSLRGRPVDSTKSGGWKAAFLALLLVSGDSLTILGIAANLLPYFVTVLQISDIDEISNIVNSYVGLTYILPVVWGYFADTMLGRFVTIVAGIIISTVGLLVLTLSASLKGLHPGKCTEKPCKAATQPQLNCLYAGLFTIAIGSAAMKPCVSSLGRDQFNTTDPIERKAGATFFQYMYLGACATIAFGVTVGIYIQDTQGFGLGWGLVSLYFLITAFSFLGGTLLYRQRNPEGSMLTRLAQVFVLAIKNIAKPLPPPEKLYDLDDVAYATRTDVKLAHTKRLRFLEKAAIVPSSHELHQLTFDGWKVCTLTQVEELKSIIQILPIWACTIIVSLLNAQIVTVAVSEALTLDRRLAKHFVIPAGSVNIFYLLGTLLFFPVYEYLLVPILVKITGNPKGLSDLRRIGLSLFLGLLAMVVAALVDGRRVHVIKANFRPSDYSSLSRGDTFLPMSVFWMVPQFGLLGATVYLLNVAQLNFFYGQTPENMRSVATSLYFTSISIGYFAATGFQKAVNSVTYKRSEGGGWISGPQFFEGGLQKFYFMTAVLTAINLTLFVAAAVWYTNKPVKEERATSQNS